MIRTGVVGGERKEILLRRGMNTFAGRAAKLYLEDIKKK